MRNIRTFLILFSLLICISLISLFASTSLPSFSIVTQLRLPRLILAIFAGGALGIVGSAFQGMLRNPLADPYIIGVSGGACLGATVAILAGLRPVQIFAFAGALVTIFVVEKLATIAGRLEREALLLSGVVCGTLASSLVMLFMTIGGRSLDEMIYLLMGWLGVIWDKKLLIGFVVSAIIVTIASFIIWLRSQELNILSLGEEEAISIGVDVECLKREIFILGSVIVGLVVSMCGAIGFIGLMVPHITRLLLGPDHRILIPGSAIMGAILLVFSDMVARGIAVYELPVGVVTSIFGVPFFLYLLRRT
ncbi:MAG: iron chelate uptake ABC transporter family permease subunit [candidate division WOR-3 bacterium]|nr:iron chelate uptake ABC transporter family permease subunit [candidate division WOR-3 bacterium]